MLPSEIKSVWQSGMADRQKMNQMRKFYEGTNSLSGIARERKDGQALAEIVINWYEVVTTTHVGFITSDRPEYSVEAGPDDPGLKEFHRIFTDNCLQAAGIEHLTSSIVYGRSVEVHSFDGENIQITMTNPKDWAFVRDEKGVIVVGVYQAKIPAGSFFDGKFSDAERTVFYVYDARHVAIFEEAQNGGMAPVSIQAHNYGRPPLVEFGVKRDRTTHFGKSFMESANAYCVTRSLLQDEIKINVAALLATINMTAKMFDEEDDDGVTALQHMKRTGIMPLPVGADAKWLTRQIDIAKFTEDLTVSRFAIHQQGYIPDISQSLAKGGAVSSISGVALKLLYQPMIQKSDQFQVYYKKGLFERIELINIVNKQLGRPTLDNATITIKRSLPQNSVEWAQYLPALITAGGISRKEAIRQLDFVEDVEKVFNEVMEDIKRRNGEQNNGSRPSSGI